jgi:hypothetical protein
MDSTSQVGGLTASLLPGVDDLHHFRFLASDASQVSWPCLFIVSRVIPTFAHYARGMRLLFASSQVSKVCSEGLRVRATDGLRTPQ